MSRKRRHLLPLPHSHIRAVEDMDPDELDDDEREDVPMLCPETFTHCDLDECARYGCKMRPRGEPDFHAEASKVEFENWYEDDLAVVNATKYGERMYRLGAASRPNAALFEMIDARDEQIKRLREMIQAAIHDALAYLEEEEAGEIVSQIRDRLRSALGNIALADPAKEG